MSLDIVTAPPLEGMAHGFFGRAGGARRWEPGPPRGEFALVTGTPRAHRRPLPPLRPPVAAVSQTLLSRQNRLCLSIALRSSQLKM